MFDTCLTVKWVPPNGGASWFPAVAIVAVPVDAGPDSNYSPPPGQAGAIDRVEFDNGDGTGVRKSLESGTVYVLNAAGKTIDAIHLGTRLPKD